MGYIGQVNIDNNTYAIGSTLFAVLDTSISGQGSIETDSQSSTTKIFTVPCDGFALSNGVTIHIKFVQAWNGTQVDEFTILKLKVGATAEKEIKNPNGAKKWAAGSIITFTYDGTYWIMNSEAFDVSSLSIDTSLIENFTIGNINNLGQLANGNRIVVTDNNGTITTGEEFSGVINQQSQETKFLREDGTWAAPTYTTNHQATLITADSNTDQATESSGSNSVYLNLVEAGSVRSSHQIVGEGGTTVTSDVNGKITITGQSGTMTSLTIQTTAPLTGGSSTATTTTGSYTIGFANQNRNTILAGPVSGSADAPSFRSLVTDDIPNTIARIESPTFTGVPYITTTPSTGDDSHKIADTAFVIAEINSKLASNDAMLFKGTIGANGTINTIANPAQTLPKSGYQAGWTYRVITSGTYAGQVCEPGDLIIAIKDGPENPGENVINADWTIAQTNIDGAVIGPNSSVVNHIATFDDLTGKVIKDSGITITKENDGFIIIGGTTPRTLTLASKNITLNTAAEKDYTDSTSASAISNTGTALVTERDIYYGLPTINNAHNYTSSSNIYAPTIAGTAGQYLKSSGGTDAPVWETFNEALNIATGNKGDLIYWSNTDTPARLSVGSSTNGQVLTLVSGVPAWADNSATDEKVALTAITTSTTATTYYAILSSTTTPTTAATRLYNSSIAFNLVKGTTNQSTGSGYSTLILGNNTNKGNAANLTGRIRLYGFSTSYTDIIGAPVTSAQTLTLPSTTGGNLVGTSTTNAVGSDTKPVYIAANGVATAFEYTIAKPTAGSLLYGSSTAAYSNLAAGNAGQILMMGSSSDPVWATINSANVYSSYTALAELTATINNEAVTIINTNELSHVYNGVLYLANSLTFGTTSAITSISNPA